MIDKTEVGDVDATAWLREQYGRCDECAHLFSPSELDAERGDPTWGHACFGSFNGNRRNPGTARCESYRVPMVDVSPLRSTPQEGMTDEFAIQLVRALWRCDSHEQRAVLLQSAFKALRVTQEGTTDDSYASPSPVTKGATGSSRSQPWEILQSWDEGRHRVVGFQFEICNDREPFEIALVGQFANAAFIVRACNSHEALLAALKAVANDRHACGAMKHRAIVAIAHAEGRS